MSLESLKETSPLLTDLSASHLEFLESVATEIEFNTGAIIFEDDDPADTFYLVARGKVGLEVSPVTGPATLIETLGPGELLGVSWLFPPYRWNWRARSLALTDTIAFDAAAVRARCEKDTELGLHLYRTVAREAVRRLHATRIRVLDMYPGGGA